MIEKRHGKAGGHAALRLRELLAQLDAYQTPELLGFRAKLPDLRMYVNIAFSVPLSATTISFLWAAALRLNSAKPIVPNNTGA